ncbi:MAG TPA: winged helix DNA-binding domain-containing protein [Acidimicrobiales bacterium]
MTAVRRVSLAERRARLGRRHHLAPGAGAADVTAAARGLVGLHATDAASVFLTARARVPGLVPADVERALYDDRSVVRVLGMRRTMFVEPVDLVPLVHAACTRAIAVRERRQLVRLLEEGGIADDGDAWLKRVESAVLAAVARRGEATAAELSDDVPELRAKLLFGEGKRWGGAVGVSTRVLFLLSAAGHLVRGRPRGSWVSTQYRWATLGGWLATPVDVDGEETGAARVGLVRRWLRAFGPGTVDDVRWWTGWTVGETRRALAALDPVEVDLGGGASGLLLPDDADEVAAPDPWVALLPALDPTMMGWTGRAWYLGEHGPALFDRSGNPGPTVWCDGRVVGGWAQRADGEVVVRLFDDVGAEAAAAVDAAADDLRAWLGDVRVVPRFRTPLERELSA